MKRSAICAIFDEGGHNWLTCAVYDSEKAILISNTPDYQYFQDRWLNWLDTYGQGEDPQLIVKTRPSIKDPAAYGIDPRVMPPSKSKSKKTNKRPHNSSDARPEVRENKRVRPTTTDAGPVAESQPASQESSNEVDATAASNANTSYDASIQVDANTSVSVKLTKENVVETLRRIDEYAEWRLSGQGKEMLLSFDEFHRVKGYFKSKG